ncbi:hypothetical protein [uncultured Ruminococcus sp.]|uniref:hypothetical protein n=1 Tax=uncultured Ruminococcus sp. TaxID=165186 RepID=UPI0025E3AF48|nr:hypothetical protein [uncultured Ruminococcus sp.]
MNNSNYPSKQERIIYKVISVLMDEICLFGKSIISAILVCVCFENGWILPQEHCGNNDFMIVLFAIFCFMQCAILINIFSKKYTYEGNIIAKFHNGEITYSGKTKIGGNENE